FVRNRCGWTQPTRAVADPEEREDRERQRTSMTIMRFVGSITITAAVCATLCAGCGASGASPTRPHSVAETTRAFSRHGLKLQRVPLPMLRARGVTYLVGVGTAVEVRVYRSAARVNDVGAILVLGSGTPTARRSRNVVVTWFGKEDPRVAAALKDLR